MSSVFLFTIFASVNFVLLICKYENLIQSLLDGSNAAWILAADNIYNLFRKTKVFFLNNLFILDDVYCNIVINEAQDIQIQILNRALNLDDVFFSHFVAAGILNDRYSTV